LIDFNDFFFWFVLDFVQVVEDVPEFKQTGEWVSYGLGM